MCFFCTIVLQSSADFYSSLKFPISSIFSSFPSATATSFGTLLCIWGRQLLLLCIQQIFSLFPASSFHHIRSHLPSHAIRASFSFYALLSSYYLSSSGAGLDSKSSFPERYIFRRVFRVCASNTSIAGPRCCKTVSARCLLAYLFDLCVFFELRSSYVARGLRWRGSWKLPKGFIGRASWRPTCELFTKTNFLAVVGWWWRDTRRLVVLNSSWRRASWQLVVVLGLKGKGQLAVGICGTCQGRASQRLGVKVTRYPAVGICASLQETGHPAFGSAPALFCC